VACYRKSRLVLDVGIMVRIVTASRSRPRVKPSSSQSRTLKHQRDVTETQVATICAVQSRCVPRLPVHADLCCAHRRTWGLGLVRAGLQIKAQRTARRAGPHVRDNQAKHDQSFPRPRPSQRGHWRGSCSAGWAPRGEKSSSAGVQMPVRGGGFK
jgi:hypothetical protein